MRGACAGERVRDLGDSLLSIDVHEESLKVVVPSKEQVRMNQEHLGIRSFHHSQISHSRVARLRKSRRRARESKSFFPKVFVGDANLPQKLNKVGPATIIHKKVIHQ